MQKGFGEMEAACLPMIDIGVLNHQCAGAVDRSLVVEQIRKACQGLGCFKVVNHGISSSVMKGALEVASDFFRLSKEEKAEYASGDIRRPVRYGGPSEDDTKKSTPRDFLKQYAHPLAEWSKFWPRLPSDYRQKMGKYATEARRVILQLMGAIMEGLGLGRAYMSAKFEDGMQVMTVNSYQKGPWGSTTLGMPAHTDYGCLTILLQSSEGLQIVDKGAKAWRAVPESPDALHVHVGDHLEVLSNGAYRSVIHRVILDDAQKRTSIASIHSLSMDEMVAPAEELVDEQRPKGYRSSSFSDFLQYAADNDFGNGGSFVESLRILAP